MTRTQAGVSYKQIETSQEPSFMPAWRIKLLYDGKCPLCTREVRFMRRRDRFGRIAFEDITAPTFDARRYGLTYERVYKQMHAVLPDGSVIHGMEVFRRAYSEIGWGWLVRPTGWPLLRLAFNGLYLLFAKVRPYLSRHREIECRERWCGMRGMSFRFTKRDNDDHSEARYLRDGG